MSKWTHKIPFWRACQKTSAKRPKNVRSCWNVFERNAKILQSMYRKGKKFPVKKQSKKSSGHAKSSWEIIGAKGFAMNYKLFLWKSEKTTKLLIVFQFLLVSKLILWTHRMHLSQIYARLVKVDLLFMPDLFSTKKRKNIAQGLKTLKSFKYFQKKTFPKKMSNQNANSATPLNVFCYEPNELFVKVPKSWRKAIFFQFLALPK